MESEIDFAAMSGRLDQIVDLAASLEGGFADELARVCPAYCDSARNLIAYIALRQVDLRDLQRELSRLGLSSLGRAERDVRASISNVQEALQLLSAERELGSRRHYRSIEKSEQELDDHREDLLGRCRRDRDVAIMVTLAAEAGEDYELVRDMIKSGMDLARINCAHDDEESWRRMAQNVRRASKELGHGCKIVMDLAGPKIRTGMLRPGPGVKRLQPKRDSLGRVIAPRHVRFVADDGKPLLRKSSAIPVPSECIDFAAIDDVIRLHDTRGKKRKLVVVAKDDCGLRLECYKTTYIATGTKFRLHRRETGEKIKFRIGNLRPKEEPIVLKIGDTLILHRDMKPGEPAKVDADGAIVEPAHISCRPTELFEAVKAGDPIHLNDGKIEGIVDRASETELSVTVTHAKSHGSRLRSNKGINLPNCDLRLPGLTDTDRRNLGFISRHADVVSLSFVNDPEDIHALVDELGRSASQELGVIVKVETVKGFENLPRLLLAAMRHRPVGIMIARGDLAVECGWERLAEIQEEMLWMCEAARMPVIWATQVLELVTKKGRPSRAEITDAAMSQRADCVMLNKGPHILAAIAMLDRILTQMQRHQHKKSPALGKLHLADRMKQAPG